ncbi:MAG: prepilin-type N-terminal cleavage/methylation domain-containing protein [Puniceicoccales bacterium]|nr:prepilin-type N-terminal cleavage/methylation domain-containing protein [Puniceicoccales bacterium]
MSFKKGFTLLEIVVAMAIFSTLITIVGKFFHYTMERVVSRQESSECQLQRGRLIRLLERDLRYMLPGEITNLSDNVYSWIKYYNDSGIEGPVRCIYVLDISGNVHRILLHENQAFSHAMLSPTTVIASGIGALSIGQTLDGGTCINIRTENQPEIFIRTVTWFPDEQ